MAVREVLRYPDARLRQKALTVDDWAQAQRIAADLIDTMEASGHSVGIAAPQIGELQRVVIVDCSDKVKKSLGRLVLVNPVIVAREGQYSMREGCMSLPDYLGQVTRARRITVQARDSRGAEIEIQAKKFEAVVIQHEMDHLDGILFIDRISSLKTDLLRRSDLRRGP